METLDNMTTAFERREQTALGLVLARWQMHTGRSGSAVSLLQQLERACTSGTRELELATIRAHLALLQQQRGDVEDALTTLGQALDYVARQHAFQVLLELGPQAQTLLHLAQQRDLQARCGSERHRVLQHVLKAIQGRGADQSGFSPREQEILAEICQGRTNKQIARALNLSENTVKFHLKNIFRKLGTNTRSAAAAVHARQMAE